MKVKIKLSLLNDDDQPFMGQGPQRLLQGIARLGSINQAAKDMNMSYVKAEKIIKNMEASLDRRILKKKIGGKDHGGSELTPFAREFLAMFTAYEGRVSNFVGEQFRLFCGRTSAIPEEEDQ